MREIVFIPTGFLHPKEPASKKKLFSSFLKCAERRTGTANNANQAELESCVFIGVGCACEGYKAATALRQPFQSAYLRALAV